MNNSSVTVGEWDGPCPFSETYFLSEDYARTLLWSDFNVKFATLVIPIISAVGILLNGSFLFVIARVKSMRTITNFYLANLAVSDIMLLVSVTVQDTLVLYVFSSGVAYNTLDGGTAFCSFYAISRETFYIVSMALITLVTTERFFAICYPLKHRIVESKGRAVKLTVCTWLACAVYGAFLALNATTILPYCFKWPDTPEFASLPQIIGFCAAAIIPPEIAVYTVDLIGALPFVVSLTVTGCMYFMIFRALSQRPDRGNEQNQTDSSNQSAATNADKTRRHVVRMLLTNTAVFFVCNLPGWLKVVLETVGTLHPDFNLTNTAAVRLWQIANVMALLNSTVNPVIYNATNPRYRRAFREAFSVGKSDRKRRRTQHSTVSAHVMTSVTCMPVPSSGNPTAGPSDARI